ncbi:MAG TPA: AraC family transcriptional regulator [Bacteroidales bacterium]|nr:AraC family transcriptional regulator [Bacteroidales bacterium]
MIDYIILLNPVYVTLFWALVFNFNSGRTDAPKSFLGVFMAVAFLVYISHFLFFLGQIHIYSYFDSIYTLASLLVYPLYHIYIRLLTIEVKFSFRKHFHFLALPVVVFFLHLTGVLLLSRQEYDNYLRYVLTDLQVATGRQVFLYYAYMSFRVVFVVQVFYYLFHNFRLVSAYNSKLHDYFSSPEGRKLYWVQLFNVIIACISLSSATVAILGRDTFTKGELPLVVPSVVFALMLFFLGLMGNNQKAVHFSDPHEEDNAAGRDYEVVDKSRNFENDLLYDNKSLLSLKQSLVRLFENEKIFKNPDLKIWDVCAMLGTNRTYVSRLINELFNNNFCSVVNQYRVRYAKDLISNKNYLPNAQIAELAGFGSVSSMQRAFLASEGMSLKRFREQVANFKVSTSSRDTA